MDAAPADQPALIKRFLDGWYKKVFKDSASYESHAGEGYTGYWSFEAAAVVMLWNIDDTSFREHQYYPDELVDFYRSQPR